MGRVLPKGVARSFEILGEAVAPDRRALFPEGPRVCQAPWRAQGIWTTVVPCSGQFTRGASASSKVMIVPRSNARHRHGPLLGHSLAPRRPPLWGRTDTTTASASSSNSTLSTTVRSSPSSHCQSLPERTPFPSASESDLQQPET